MIVNYMTLFILGQPQKDLTDTRTPKYSSGIEDMLYSHCHCRWRPGVRETLTPKVKSELSGDKEDQSPLKMT